MRRFCSFSLPPARPRGILRHQHGKGRAGLRANTTRSLILRTIYQSDGMALTDLSRAIGLSTVSVKHHVDRLLEEGKVRKSHRVRQARGRPREILRIDPRGGYLVGVDMDPSGVTAVVTNMGRCVVAQVQRRLPVDGSGRAITGVLARAARDAIGKARIPKSRLMGIGFAVTGFYDRDAGVGVMSSALPRWRNVPVRSLLQGRFDCPVAVDDSVTAATMAERWFGKGMGVDDFVALRVRTGMSLGIVAGGELYRGAGSSGTVNDLYALPAAAALKAGQSRSLFQLGSGYAMLKRLRRQVGPRRSPRLWKLIGGDAERLTLARFLEATRQDDPLCVAVLTDAARAWGHALAHIYSLLHPQKAILCGAFDEFADLLRPPLLRAMDQDIFPALRGRTTVEFSELGSASGALGAAALALGDAVRKQ